MQSFLESKTKGQKRSCTERPEPASGGAVKENGMIVGEIVDTHHPHLPGRIFVRWWETVDRERTAWLHYERHLSLRQGDRVLLAFPSGWGEGVVIGALSRPGETAKVETQTEIPSSEVQSEPITLPLEPGQTIEIVSHEGQPLLSIRQGRNGPIVQLPGDNAELSARRSLRISADSVEIAAGAGGVNVRTEGEAVTRARIIRLN